MRPYSMVLVIYTLTFLINTFPQMCLIFARKPGLIHLDWGVNSTGDRERNEK